MRISILILLLVMISGCSKKHLRNPEIKLSSGNDWLLFENSTCYLTKNNEKWLVPCYKSGILISDEEFVRIMKIFKSKCQ